MTRKRVTKEEKQQRQGFVEAALVGLFPKGLADVVPVLLPADLSASRFKPRSVTRQARLLGITWLQILWTAVLCVLVSAVVGS